MDPLRIARFAVEAVIILAGLGIPFLGRNRWSGAVDPSHEDGASLQKTNGENGTSATAELAAHGRDDTGRLTSSSSVSAQTGHEFEVFLSFRGIEIRKTFADYLYHYLTNLGVRTFRDNEELHVGEKIGRGLMRAIERSKISIPIFTKDYASSKWCLMEVAEMVKRMKDASGKQVIMPIFFDVTPDVVQHQTGTYAAAFAQHEKKFDPETVKEWRNALEEVVKLKGLELSKATNGNEGEFTTLVVAEVLKELRQAWLDVSEILVGLDDPVEEVKQMLELDLNDIQMIGIWGTGGIGKTTLAKHVYNKVAQHFECCSFLSDVRETYRKPGGPLELQSKLASDILGLQIKNNLTSTDDATNVLKSRLRVKKSLILLDDVDHTKQLKDLAADPHWFGSGSRIIVTTREKEVLSQFPWFKVYELKQLKEDLALELFCKYTFLDELHSLEFVDLSWDVVRITGGLPLALVLTGSFLYANRGKKGVWKDTIEQLKRRPHKDVQEKLRISYDALEDEQKEIFLDISCFFIGWDYRDIIPVWDDCKFSPRLGIEVLQLKSLIKIDDKNKLRMHDQLRDLGRHIVEHESSTEPELRSRLWRSEESIDVISRQQGTSKIEGAEILTKEKGAFFSDKCFQNLLKLRILILRGNVELTGDYQHLMPHLRLLSWRYGRMHQPNLPLNNLVFLDLSYSIVDEDWIGRNSIKMVRLKVLSLLGCNRLRRSPDFSTFPNLERLNFRWCDELVSIDASIGLLKNLNFLDLGNCFSLRKLPDQLGHLEELAVLVVDETKVEEIPISSQMKKLEFLSANGCHHLNRIPQLVGSLTNLRRLSLEECSSLRQLPETVGQLTSLTELQLQSSGLTCLPKTLGNLTQLQVMDVRGCSLMKGEALGDIGSLSFLRVLTLNLMKGDKVPLSIGGLSNLQTLHLNLGRCWNQQTLPDLPSNLISLAIEGSSSRIVPAHRVWESLNGRRNLNQEKEQLDFCGDHMMLKKCCLPQLCKLEKLVLRAVNLTVLPEEISAFSRLKEFEISHCTKLEWLPVLPSNLCSLEFYDCGSLQKLPTLSNLSKLSTLSVHHTRLKKIDGFRDLISLQYLSIHDCPSTMLDGVERIESLVELSITSCDLQSLPELSNSQRLRWLDASDNRLLVDAQGINNLPQLEHIDLSNCTLLERLPDLSKFGRLHFLCIRGCKEMEKLLNLSLLQNLYHLDVEGCEKLGQVKQLEELTSLWTLNISGCIGMENVPCLSKLQKLSFLRMGNLEKSCQLSNIGELGFLHYLDISGCNAIENLSELSKLERLRRLNMRDCVNLSQIDKLVELKNLEELDISGCNKIEKLSELPKLQKLRKLKMEQWEQPDQIEALGGLESLKELDLSISKSIEKLPKLLLPRLAILRMRSCKQLRQLDMLEELRSLQELDISQCEAIEKLDGLSKLLCLRHLKITGCKKLGQLDEIRELISLKELDLSGCKAIDKLPNLSKLQHLWHLNMSGCERLIQLDGIGELALLMQLDISECKSIKKLPEWSKQHSLKHMNMRGCKKLNQLDGIEELESLEHLDISYCKAIEKLPSLARLSKLQYLNMRGCEKLNRVDEIVELGSLKQLDVGECKAIEKLLDLSKLQSLWHLSMRKCEKLSWVDEIDELESIEELALNSFKSVERLPDISKLKRLRWLQLEACEELHKLGLETLESLEHLEISRCNFIEKLPDLSKLQTLYSLQVKACKSLHQMDMLEEFESLRTLDISGSKAIERLPKLSKHYNLSILYMRGCSKLQQLDGLGELISLEELDISYCGNIQNLPNLRKLQRLRMLKVRACKKLCQLEGLEGLYQLEELDISGCKAIVMLPDLLQLQKLRCLRMRGCEKLLQL